MQNILFLYNELQEGAVQVSIFGRVLTGTSDSLGCYRLYPPHAPEAGPVTPFGDTKIRKVGVHSDNQADRISGTAFEVSESELLVADSHESRADCSRVKVILESGKQAWAYVAAHQEYPRYFTYKNTGKRASLFKQEFPLPSLEVGEVYYPANKFLSQEFSTELEEQKFGAGQFYSFLADTIEVEHCLVIPAIATLRRIPYKIPSEPKQDLYRIATDEGFHAEQANAFLVELEKHFQIPCFFGVLPPLFIRRLKEISATESDPILRDLLIVINGIVTETRISVELGKFAANRELSDSVRRICGSHAKDEFMHSTQFQALGHWLWEEFDEPMKKSISEFYIRAIIARSLPDVDRLALVSKYATGRSVEDSYRIVLSNYNADKMIDEMLIAAKPTLAYLRKLGLESFISFEAKIDDERQRIEQTLDGLRK